MKVHLIGIGGAGLSAIATVLLQQGHTVSGSDIQASAATERLSRLGARIFIGHRPENLNLDDQRAASGEASDLDAVIVSSAIVSDNLELIEARRRGLVVLKRAEWLGQMMKDRLGIAVAGTHGKTTTTAMIAFMLREAGQDPTFIVGGFIPQLDTNAAAGAGEAFVIEADEYDRTFLGLRPEVAVVTAVEWDHPDIYPTPELFREAFEDFIRLVPAQGLVIGCGDDAGVRTVLKQARARVMTYGLQPGSDWQAAGVTPNQRGGIDFKLVKRQPEPAKDVPPINISLAVPGRHNVLNALATMVVGDERGIESASAAEILSRYQGVSRRFELKGEVQGITVIDDYAHHPTEIKSTLAAARIRFGQRPVWVMFQPHTFSRTISLLPDFATAFSQADHVIVVDIFASREIDQGWVTSQNIVNLMSHPDARYIGSLIEAADYLVTHLSSPAVLLTMGAGDGYQVGEWVLERLKVERSNV